MRFHGLRLMHNLWLDMDGPKLDLGGSFITSLFPGRFLAITESRLHCPECGPMATPKPRSLCSSWPGLDKEFGILTEDEEWKGY